MLHLLQLIHELIFPNTFFNRTRLSTSGDFFLQPFVVLPISISKRTKVYLIESIEAAKHQSDFETNEGRGGTEKIPSGGILSFEAKRMALRRTLVGAGNFFLLAGKKIWTLRTKRNRKILSLSLLMPD